MHHHTLIAGLLACTMSFLAASCGKGGKTGTSSSDRAVPVRTLSVKASRASGALTVSGNVEARKTVRLSFLVAGRIASISGEEGSTLRRGQVAASLEPESYATAKEMADIQVAQAQDEYNRLRLLHERKSVSESDFLKCEFALRGAKAQQRLRSKNLADTRIIAPISGILLKKLAEAGETVSSGIPVMELADISQVKICAYIPEGDLRNIRIGQSAQVTIAAVPLTVTARVAEIGGVADPVARAFTIKLTADNPGLKIRPGMIAEVALSSATAANAAIWIPTTALLHDADGRSYVYIADLSKHRAYRRNVSIGQTEGDMTRITSGLKAGETLVTGGQQKLANGTKVVVKN